MPLPKLVVPEYELELPSSKETIKYRPFLVKEEKLLLTAMEMGGEKEMINAIKTIIKNCTSLKGRIDDLATFDIEYVFLKIRSKSVGEVSKILVTCPDDGETQVQVDIPLDQIEVKWPEKHSNTIELTHNVGLIMKYPSIDTFVKLNFTGENITVDNIFELAATCIDQIYEGEEIYETKNFTKKRSMSFLKV